MCTRNDMQLIKGTQTVNDSLCMHIKGQIARNDDSYGR